MSKWLTDKQVLNVEIRRGTKKLPVDPAHLPGPLIDLN
jgi:hypothetical protein